MLLSDRSTDDLVAASQPAWAVGDRARRASAREAVNAAAAELELDPPRPSLPRVAAGEDVQHAALRVLRLEKAEKALEAARTGNEAQRAHAVQVARRIPDPAEAAHMTGHSPDVWVRHYVGRFGPEQRTDARRRLLDAGLGVD